MTQRILMITEEPNKEAAQLPCREDLFNLKLNPFSQFFGRILFGSEKCFRACFNDKLVMWKHARGSKLLQDDRGKRCIQNYIKNHANEIELIVTFGIPAAGTVLPKEKADIKEMSVVFQNGLRQLCNICNRPHFNRVTIPVAALPHTSGRAQSFWMEYPCVWSKLVEEIQEKACKICRDSNNCCCSSCK